MINSFVFFKVLKFYQNFLSDLCNKNIDNNI